MEKPNNSVPASSELAGAATMGTPFMGTPYMGWNSYDYYCTEVNEEEVLANARVMADKLKPFSWEYVVIDISWYEPKAGSRSREFQYLPFAELSMDNYGRLMPDEERFPSSKGGAGFKPLADQIHAMGLKFGIHIMRGIPRLAAHRHLPILTDGSELAGSTISPDVFNASEAADPSNICSWNPYMYGIRPNHSASQAYYDSIMQLYASWGVDYIKCDDICREDMASAHDEIAMLHEAILRCGRPIILSLSPGPAKITEAEHYRKNANLWRISDDFWDTWPLLKDMFRRCELWQGQATPGHYPDLDMLPLGVIGGRFGDKTERITHFTPDEQRTMLTLWCIFGAPMMIGAELTRLDDFTLDMLTRQDILAMLSFGANARQLKRSGEEAIWASCDPEVDTTYVALFNLSDEERAINIWTAELIARGLRRRAAASYQELWSGQQGQTVTGAIAESVPPHGVKLIRIE